MTTEEYSSGIIPVRKQQGQWEVFVIKHRKGHWAFPKGHAHPDESTLESALRECAHTVNVGISNSFGFGGHNAVIVAGAYRQ